MIDCEKEFNRFALGRILVSSFSILLALIFRRARELGLMAWIVENEKEESNIFR